MIVGLLFDNKFFSLVAITGFGDWKLKLDNSILIFKSREVAAMFRNFSGFHFIWTLALRLAGGVDSEGLENTYFFTHGHETGIHSRKPHA